MIIHIIIIIIKKVIQQWPTGNLFRKVRYYYYTTTTLAWKNNDTTKNLTLTLSRWNARPVSTLILALSNAYVRLTLATVIHMWTIVFRLRWTWLWTSYFIIGMNLKIMLCDGVLSYIYLLVSSIIVFWLFIIIFFSSSSSLFSIIIIMSSSKKKNKNFNKIIN